MTSNRMPGPDFGLGETVNMVQSAVGSFAWEREPRAEEIDARDEFRPSL